MVDGDDEPKHTPLALLLKKVAVQQVRHTTIVQDKAIKKYFEVLHFHFSS